MATNRACKDPTSAFDIGSGPQLPNPTIVSTGKVSNEVYYSEAQYEQEISNIFHKSWLYVARANEVPDAGNFVVRDLLGFSILIVRGKDGTIRAFHNACTHRSTRLVWETQGSKPSSFVCPFHGWCFSAEGHLTHVPDKEGFSAIDEDALHLKSIRCEIYGTFIFINLDTSGTQTLTAYLGEWGERHDGLPWGGYDVVGRISAISKFNWKLGVEIGTETYHAATLHKFSLGHLIPKDNPFLHQPQIDFYGPHSAYTTPINPDFALPNDSQMRRFVAPLVMPINARPGDAERVGTNAGDALTFATHPGVNLYKAPDFGSSNYIIFPNTLMVISAAGWHTARFWPLGPDETYWEVEFSYTKPKTWSEKFAQEAAMTANRDAMFEDMAMAAAQNKAIRTKAVDHSQFNDWGELLPRHHAACVKTLTGAQ